MEIELREKPVPAMYNMLYFAYPYEIFYCVLDITNITYTEELTIRSLRRRGWELIP